MALKAMVIKAGWPNAGALLGIYDADDLPPLARDNDGTVMTTFLATAGGGQGKAWDNEVRAFVTVEAPEPTSDPVFAGEDEFFLYVAPDGTRTGGGFTDTGKPAGTEAVKLQGGIPDVDKRWSKAQQTYVERVGIRSVLERRLFEPIKARVQALEWMRDHAGSIPNVPPEALAGFQALMDARIIDINEEFAFLIGAYVEAKDQSTDQP